MTPAARVQTAIEILDAIVTAAREGGAPADAILADALRQRRYAGSKDRRAIRGHVYDAIRAAGTLPQGGRAAMLLCADRDPALAALFDGTPYGPAPIRADEARADAALPPWFDTRFDPIIDGDERAALLTRAPLDLRVNGWRADRDAVLALFDGARPIDTLPLGVRLPGETAAVQHPGFADGWFEVQDAASQWAAAAVGAQTGERLVDLCAGAGGKTLALAATDGVELIACDTNRARLQQLGPRAARAGIDGIATRLLNPGREAEMLADLAGRVDRVLIDAPCSGSGTWRRSPELRWRLTPERLDAVVALQARLLRMAAALLRPGGTLVYVVCSVLRDEGRDQAAAFMADHPRWTLLEPGTPPGVGRAAEPGLLMTPHHDGSDGFFLARFRAP